MYEPPGGISNTRTSGFCTHAPAFLGLQCEFHGHGQLHGARVHRAVRSHPLGAIGEADGGAHAGRRGSGLGRGRAAFQSRKWQRAVSRAL